jgi:hypothetical protein
MRNREKCGILPEVSSTTLLAWQLREMPVNKTEETNMSASAIKRNGVILSVMLFLGACSGGGSSESDGAVIRGLVQSPSGQGLAGISILVDGKSAGNTDYRGFFLVDPAPTGEGVVVKTESPHYSVAVQRIALAKGDQANLVLTCLSSQMVRLDDAGAGGRLTGADGFALDVPAGSLKTAEGTAVTGQVYVYYSLIRSVANMAAAPGGMLVDQGAGATGQLESFGMVAVRFFQNEEPLVFSGSAELHIPLADGAAFAHGDSVGLYSFNESSGLWQEEGTGTVDTSLPSGIAVLVANVTHFSWWNCDEPLENKNCITGVARDGDGNPLADLFVIATGEDYLGGGNGRTIADGSFCVNVKRNSSNSLSIWGAVPNGWYTWSQTGVLVPDESTDCTLGGCLDLGELTLTTTSFTCVSASFSDFPEWFWQECPQGCFSGEVLDENGALIAWVEGSTDNPGGSTADVCFTIPEGTTFRIGSPWCTANGETEFPLTNVAASCESAGCQDLGDFVSCQ